MASTIPEQYRAVDPFASYNSNTVNQITEVRSRGENLLDNRCGMDVVADSTSTARVTVLPGYCYKDDMMIRITEEHSIDFTDPEQYISFDLTYYTAPGYFYVVLEYTYIKSRPSPQAKIKIVMPGQRTFYDYGTSSTSLIFLKAVYVSSTGPFTIDSVHDFDPTLPNNEREYATRYVSPVTQLPSFEQCRDEGRLAYETETNQYWIGTDVEWLRLAGKYVYLITGPGDWTLSGSDYYHDIDVSGLSLDSQDVVVSCRDTSTNFVITPGDIDLSTSDVVRIWMPVNTVSLSVTII